MYLLNWNPDDRLLEASLGGYVTANEAEVFVEDLAQMLQENNDAPMTVCIDYSAARRIEDGVLGHLEAARETCFFASAAKVIVVARTEEEIERFTDDRLQHVLDGREEYRLYGLAS